MIRSGRQCLKNNGWRFIHCTGGIPKKKKCKKANWLSGETLQIPEKRRQAKGKRERERYTQLNADLQKIARRDKKALFGE